MRQPDLADITTRIIRVTSEQLGILVEKITPDSRLIEDLHCDSLAMVELMMEVEQEFRIALPETGSSDSGDPIYKAVFTRTPFRVRDFAELVVIQLEASPAPTVCDQRWLACQTAAPSTTVPFRQLVGGAATDQRGYDPIGTDEEGRPLFRRRVDGMCCVWLPGGECTIGSDSYESDEAPAHRAALSPFLIDIEPVSVAAYARFLNSTSAPDPTALHDWCALSADDHRHDHVPLLQRDGVWRAREGTERWPMILVSWYGANAYSLWANGLDPGSYREVGFVNDELTTLPSEAQWEYAARGLEYQHYPWGDASPTSELARFGFHRRKRQYELLELPICDVNVAMGQSPLGLRHMAGNIWQWCADWYDSRFYGSEQATTRDPINLSSTGVRSERGGSWIGTGALLRSSYRRGRNPIARGRCLGFRCCGGPPK